MKLFYKALAVLTALLITVPFLAFNVSADQYADLNNPLGDLTNEITNKTYNAQALETVYIQGSLTSGDSIIVNYYGNNIPIVWEATLLGNNNVTFRSTNNVGDQVAAFSSPGASLTFQNATLGSVNISSTIATVPISFIGNNTINGNLTLGNTRNITIPSGTVINGDIIINNEATVSISRFAVFDNLTVSPTATVNWTDEEEWLAAQQAAEDAENETVTASPSPATPSPETGETKSTDKLVLKSENHLFPTFVRPVVEITDDTPFEQDGQTYYGIVDIVSVDTDKPQEIPKEVFIDGHRYLVGETVYIVGEKEKIIETTADTGFSYVFTAVENSDYPVKFTAEGLPEGLEMSEDGVITTKTLPAPVGTFKIKVTADNGADTNVYELTIEIKSEMTDEELLKSLTENDIPELLTEPQENVYKMWVNEELSIHYEPDIDDFYAVFLDGKLLSKDDYRVEEGSTVIILTEQTIAPLPNGDHVVTTMFHQDSDVGLDTVINDVGSSSFVFRFGDERTDHKRINISGDGVSGSVTFDDKDAKETSITTISANTEAIEQRAKNLSNATGCEIIAAFETKQSGGFGGGEGGIDRSDDAGRVATFAVSVKSLDLTLKDGTAVYIAVYDAKSGKTYQNKGEVKDGMIVFKTKHSGVFMISLEKY